MSNQEQNLPKKAKKQRHWFRRTILALFILAILGIGALGMYLSTLGTFEADKLRNDPLTSQLYDKDGNKILSVHGAQNRVYVSVKDMPTHLKNAFIAAEDVRFYSHPGFDVIRIVGALWTDIRTQSLSQGASTITQQLVKNTHLTAEKTWTRKIKEAYYAFQIEQAYSKDDILEMYMNHVYLGNGAYGVQAAAQSYFGVDIGDLTIAQSASLAAILKAPSNYSPHIEPENNIRRRNIILDTMLEEEMISQSQYDQAKASTIKLAPQQDQLGDHGWFTDAALEEACTILDVEYEELLSGGYQIYTTLDSALQTACEDLYADAALFPENAADGTPCQSALVVLDTPTGQVRALIGGREYLTRRALNRATQMRRQPGSTLKPFAVYAPAIEQKAYTGVSILSDIPTDFEGYMPRNYGDNYRGQVTLRTALARSINVPAVGILNQLGIPAGIASVNNFGIALDPNDGYLPMALGALTYGATPLEMANAYSALGSGGVLHPAYLVTQIKSPQGIVLYKANPQAGKATSAPTAYVLTDILRSAASWGTASKLGATGIEVAGKTGTVAFEGDLNRDAWTCAYTPQTTIAVWMGFDITDAEHSMGKSVTGGALPAALAAQVLVEAQSQNIPFEIPSGVEVVQLDKRALENDLLALRATDITPPSEQTTEVFLPGTAPTQYSNYWVIPSPPSDFRAEEGLGKLPLLRFTIGDSAARYRLYRLYRQQDNSPQEELAVFAGAAGDTVEYSDISAQARETYVYTIVPEHAEAVDMGMTNATGPASNRVVYTVPGASFEFPFDFDDLFGIGNTPTPTPTPGLYSPSPSAQAPTPSPTPVVIPTPPPTPIPTQTPAPTPTPTPNNSPLFGF